LATGIKQVYNLHGYRNTEANKDKPYMRKFLSQTFVNQKQTQHNNIVADYINANMLHFSEMTSE
jgi:hypothetical protein